MTDEISSSELGRRLDDLSRDMKEDLAEILRRQDAYVLREVYAVERRASDARLDHLERQIQNAEEQRKQLFRWVISAVIVPTVALIVTVVLNVQGGP